MLVAGRDRSGTGRPPDSRRWPKTRPTWCSCPGTASSTGCPPRSPGCSGGLPEECIGRPGEFSAPSRRHRAWCSGSRAEHALRGRFPPASGRVTCARTAESCGASRGGHPDRGAADGEVEGAVVSIRDVTDQIELEEQREAAEARYRLVAEHASDVVYVADPDGDFAWVSPSVRAVLGWSPEELVGTSVGLRRGSPVDLATREQGLGRAVFGEVPLVRDRSRCGSGRRPVSPAVDVAAGRPRLRCHRCGERSGVQPPRLCQDEVIERVGGTTLRPATPCWPRRPTRRNC